MRSRPAVHAWLAADPLNAEAFARLRQSGTVRKSPSARKTGFKTRESHLPPTAASTLETAGHRRRAGAGLFSFSNLPMRGRPIICPWSANVSACNWRTARKSCSTPTRRSPAPSMIRSASRGCSGRSVFEVAANRNQPLEIDAARSRPACATRVRRALSGRNRAGQCAAWRCRFARHPHDARVRLSAGESIRIGPTVSIARPSRRQYDLAWVQGRLGSRTAR